MANAEPRNLSEQCLVVLSLICRYKEVLMCSALASKGKKDLLIENDKSCNFSIL